MMMSCHVEQAIFEQKKTQEKKIEEGKILGGILVDGGKKEEWHHHQKRRNRVGDEERCFRDEKEKSRFSRAKWVKLFLKA